MDLTRSSYNIVLMTDNNFHRVMPETETQHKAAKTPSSRQNRTAECQNSRIEPSVAWPPQHAPSLALQQKNR